MEEQQPKDEAFEELMAAFAFPWEKGEKPYFTNAEGFEWYVDKETTEWAHRKDQHGTKLENIVGFFVRKGKFAERVLMDKEINQIVYSSTSLEAVAYHIDALKALKRFDG